MKFLIVFGLIGIGFLLLILSGLWPMMFTGEQTWTPEKAARWAEIKDKLHNLSFYVNNPKTRTKMHSGPELGQAKAEFDRLTAEGEQLKVEFESAAQQPQTMSRIFKWTGIFFAAVGVIGWFAVNQSS
jgi:hypothetical protein